MVKVTILGNLGRDVQIVETKNDNKFAKLVVASNERVNGVDKTQWFDVIWFGYSPKMVETLKKGSSLVITGSLDVTSETGTDGTTYIRRSVIADYVGYNNTGKRDEGATTAQPSDASSRPTTKKSTQTPPSDDELNMGNKKQGKFVDEGIYEPENNDLPF